MVGLAHRDDVASSGGRHRQPESQIACLRTRIHQEYRVQWLRQHGGEPLTELHHGRVVEARVGVQLPQLTCRSVGDPWMGMAEDSDVVDHVEVRPARGRHQEVPPSALDLRRLGVVVLLHLREAFIAPCQQVVVAVRDGQRGKAKYLSRVAALRQPPRREFSGRQSWRGRRTDGLHLRLGPPARVEIGDPITRPYSRACSGDRRDVGQCDLVIVAAQRDALRVGRDNLAVPRRHRAGVRRGPEADARRHHVGTVLAQRRCEHQPGLTKAGEHDGGAVFDCGPCEFVLDVGPQPTAGLERIVVGVRLRRQIQRRHRVAIESPEEWRADCDRLRLGGKPEVRLDQRRHHVHRNRRGLLEHPDLGVGLFGDIRVVGVQDSLLRAADDQHRGPQHQQRP